MDGNQENLEARHQLSVCNVSKEFSFGSGNSLVALDNVSFEVQSNEICILLGPSGCGKSTMLRMVAGLEEPTSGMISLGGKGICGAGRDRGMVFQSYTSFDWLTVQKNVEYGMRLNGLSKAECMERAGHFIELVNLTKFKNAYPSQLSGGMKQRVAIARTLANDPSILLMDEPFGALDAETRWTMQELTMKIAETSKTTVLMVTHDIEEAIVLAHRIIFLSINPGRVKENMTMDFKQGHRGVDKESILELPGYHEIDKKIMRMMREESSSRDDDG
jgi:NitT/TauT family transport system ATP-binding protein